MSNIQDTPVRVEQMPMHPTISENNYAGVTAEELAAFHSGLSPAKGSNPLSTVEAVTSALPPAPAPAPAPTLASTLSSSPTTGTTAAIASAPGVTSTTQPQQTLPLNGPSEPSDPSDPSEPSLSSTLPAESLHSHSSPLSDPTTKHGCGDRYFYAAPSAPGVREEFEGFEVGAEDEVAPVRSAGDGRVMGTEEELFG